MGPVGGRCSRASRNWQRNWKINSTKPTPDWQSPFVFSASEVGERVGGSKSRLSRRIRDDPHTSGTGTVSGTGPRDASRTKHIFSLLILFFFNKMEPNSSVCVAATCNCVHRRLVKRRRMAGGRSRRSAKFATSIRHERSERT